LDGQKAYLYATVGSFFFKVIFTDTGSPSNGIPVFQISIVQVPISGNKVSTPIQIRGYYPFVSLARASIAKNSPFIQGKAMLLVPLAGSVILGTNGIPPLASDPTLVSMINVDNLSGTSGVSITNFALYKSNPAVNGSSTTDTLITEVQFNQTASGTLGQVNKSPSSIFLVFDNDKSSFLCRPSLTLSWLAPARGRGRLLPLSPQPSHLATLASGW
jgi:hypothetical protein